MIATDNALRVLQARYLLRDESGGVSEKPEDLFRRVARAVAAPDARLPFQGRSDPAAAEEEFLGVLTAGLFLPNSPTLMNAGKPAQQLSACFVLPVEDSMEGIFETLKHTAVIHKTGGGTGFSFSRLRPRNSPVRSTRGIASGPVSFMRVFNAATEAVKQGGARRGANMGILRVDHPDILEFVRCKTAPGEITNFNLSVAATTRFMEAVHGGGTYELIHPATGRSVATLPAREVFDEIVRTAWECGDPGLVFIDRISEANPTRHVAEIEATNPCGEQPLMPNESCTLGSINLGLLVGEGQVEWERLAAVCRTAVHFLDNVVDASQYPVPEIGEVTRLCRRIGVGVMGWADMLIRLGIPYDSEEAISLGERVMAFVNLETKKASSELASGRGPFPAWPGSAYDRPGGLRLRNATTTTVAPTGTISIIAGASSGIEPLFAVALLRRHVLDGGELADVHPLFLQTAERRGFDSPELMEEVRARGSLRGVGGIPDDVRRLFVTAHEIAPAWHVRMQAAFQSACDNGVSKTVNFPAHATCEEIAKTFLLAWELGCKGITVFRDGCRGSQVLNAGLAAGGGTARSAAAEDECPDCGGALVRGEGERRCRWCGYPG